MPRYSYEVYVDTTGLGHAFIGLNGPNGSETWGYYPGNDNKALPETSSAGHKIVGNGVLVRDDRSGKNGKMHDYNWSTGKRPISEQKYNAMKNAIDDLYQNGDQGKWFVLGNNCVQFVENVMMIGGERMPTEDAFSPFTFKLELQFKQALKKLFSAESSNPENSARIASLTDGQPLNDEEDGYHFSPGMGMC